MNVYDFQLLKIWVDITSDDQCCSLKLKKQDYSTAAIVYFYGRYSR